MANPTQELIKLRRIEAFMKAGTAGEDYRVNVVRWVPQNDDSAPADAGTGGAAASATAPEPPRAAILFVHGFNHYASPIFSWLAAKLWTTHRIQCFGIEHRGHGKTEGIQSFIPSFDHLVNDLLKWCRIIKAQFLPAGLPLFLHGESMGGAISLHAASKPSPPFQGMILMGPMIGIDPGLVPNPIVVAIGKAIAAIAPSAALVPVKDVMKWVFKDPAKLAENEVDPVRYRGRLRLRTGFSLQEACAALEAPGMIEAICVPFLLQHGTGDRITLPERSSAFFAASAAPDRHLRLYTDGFHTLWWETTAVRARVYDDVCEWIQARCPAREGDGPVDEVWAPGVRTSTFTPTEEDLMTPYRVAGDEWVTPWTSGTHFHEYSGQSPADSPEVME